MSEEALKNTVESDPTGLELAESPREFSQLVDLRGYKTKFQSCASGTGWYFWFWTVNLVRPWFVYLIHFLTHTIIRQSISMAKGINE